jgi:hypothetical protein
MSKLMWIAGILLIAVGIALGLMVFVSPASVIGWSLTPEVAAILLVGGVMSLGLGGVISAIETRPLLSAEPHPETRYAAAAEEEATSIPEFGRRLTEAPVAVTAAAMAAANSAEPSRETFEVSEPVKETIHALEQARQKIERAFDPQPVETPVVEAVAEPVEEPAAVEEPVVEEATSEEEAVAEEEIAEAEIGEDEVIEEGQLYVVEERLIRARPARILSDGTVEAETDEGWMRFENLDHLDEYLDAMIPAARG